MKLYAALIRRKTPNSPVSIWFTGLEKEAIGTQVDNNLKNNPQLAKEFEIWVQEFESVERAMPDIVSRNLRRG